MHWRVLPADCYSGGVDPRAVIQLGLLANANTGDSLTQREAKTTIESMIKKEIRRREASQ